MLIRFDFFSQLQPSHLESRALQHPVGHLAFVNNLRWSAGITDDSLYAVIVWVLLLVVLQAAAWPLVRRIFHRFPDEGWSFGRLLTLATSSWLVWYLASLEAISFSAAWSWTSLTAVSATIWIGLPRLSRRISAGCREKEVSLPAWKNPYILADEAVFWLFFALFLTFRVVNPDSYHPIWGGEKPMEFAHINSILRSSQFPPIDPWYAGGHLNYYYYGSYLVAFMLRLTGIPSEIGFNLAQPTFAALLASGAFGVGSAFASRTGSSPKIVVIGGVVTTILMSLSGNLVVAARLLAAVHASIPPLSDFIYWFWDPTRVPAAQPIYSITEFPYFSATFGDLHAHVIALPLTVLIVGLAYALLLDIEGFASSSTSQNPVSMPLRVNWLCIGLLGLILGILFMTNSWDTPTYSALIFASLWMTTNKLPAAGKRVKVTAALVACVAATTWLATMPFVRHFEALTSEIAATRDRSQLLSVESHFGVFLLIISFGLCALLYHRRTAIHLVTSPLYWSGLLSIILLIRWAITMQGGHFSTVADGVAVLVVVGMTLIAFGLTTPDIKASATTNRKMQALALFAGLVTASALFLHGPVLALYLGLGTSAALCWIVFPGITERFIAMMIAGAMFVAAGTELFYVVDDLTNTSAYRMNTVFKFYNGVWTLLALACGGLLSVLITRSISLEHFTDTHEKSAPSVGHGWFRTGIVISATAILASLSFPLFSTSARLDQRFEGSESHPTLDALDWMHSGTILTSAPSLEDFALAERNYIQLREPVLLSFSNDRDVILWFNSEVPGTPTIAEASIDPYRCGGSRISVHTGLPVPMGWVRHEQQQRPSDDLIERREDLRILYTTTDVREKERIIAKYDIEYIVVGEIERHYLTDNCVATVNDQGIEAFTPLIGSTLSIVFRSGETLVYRVSP